MVRFFERFFVNSGGIEKPSNSSQHRVSIKASIQDLKSRIEYSRDSFRLQQTFDATSDDRNPRSSYSLSRYFEPRQRNDGKNDETSIHDFLPAYKDKTLKDILDEKTQDADSEHPVVILDIGSGNNVALKGITDTYGDRVKVFGLTASRFADEEEIHGEIKVGDLAELRRIYPKETFDVIYSCRTLTYAHRNIMNLLPKIYSLLKTDGIALLDTFAENNAYLCNVQQFSELQHWIKDAGYDLHLESTDDWAAFDGKDMLPGYYLLHNKDDKVVSRVAMRKTQQRPRLRLPISYTESGEAYFNKQKAFGSIPGRDA